jgi:hypothetical protein
MKITPVNAHLVNDTRATIEVRTAAVVQEDDSMVTIALSIGVSTRGVVVRGRKVRRYVEKRDGSQEVQLERARQDPRRLLREGTDPPAPCWCTLSESLHYSGVLRSRHAGRGGPRTSEHAFSAETLTLSITINTRIYKDMRDSFKETISTLHKSLVHLKYETINNDG